MTNAPGEAPLVVYGTTASYYTGKLEAYLRAKGVPYRLEPFSQANMRRAAPHTGLVQVPQAPRPAPPRPPPGASGRVPGRLLAGRPAAHHRAPRARASRAGGHAARSGGRV